MEEFKHELDECVLKMYGLQNNYFVDYALNVQIPMLCGNYSESECDLEELSSYTKVFVEIWKKRLERSGLFYSIELYPNIKGRFAAFKMQLSFDKRENDICVVNCIDDNIELLTHFMIYKLNDGFY